MTRLEAEIRLQQTFKLQRFYDDQWATIERLLKGERVLLIEKTGFGKSLCFQFPATLWDRKVLAIEIDYSMPTARVIRTLEQIFEFRGKPSRLRMDNGPEFISALFEIWCNKEGIELQYIQPGRPTQNAYIESFNGLYRRHVLDAHLFETLEEVRMVTEDWIIHYNTEKPHQSLLDLTPQEYLLKYGQLDQSISKAELTTFQQNDDDGLAKNSFL